MSFNSSVTTSNLTAGSASEAIVLQALTDAVNAWSSYIAGVGTLVVNLGFVSLGAPSGTNSYILGDGGPTAYDPTVKGNGVINAAQDVLIAGNQIAPADINVNFNADLLPSITGETSPYNLLGLMEHELEHGLGMSGFLGNNAPAATLRESRYDELVQVNPNGSEYFTGSNAERVYGGPVPLTTQVAGSDTYHLGAAGTSADGSLSADLMAPFLTPGATISTLDVAILADLGLPLTAAGAVLTNPYATLTATSGSVGGAMVSDPLISGTTQAGEQVTITVGGTVLTTVTADANGNWAFRATGLTDGNYFLVATIPTINGTAAFGVPINLDATTPAVTAFQQILGRAPNAANISNLRTQLVNGTTVAAIRTSIATGPEATSDIAGAYSTILGRPAQSSDLTGWQGALAAGSSLATLRATLANSPEAANAISNTYLTTLGRPAAAADIAGWQANLAAGQTLSQLRALSGASPEAQAAINAAYVGELGRAATSADIAGWSLDLQQGITLAFLHTQLGASTEAGNAISNTYQSVLGRPAQPADTNGWKLNLEAGQTLSTLRSLLAGSGEAASAVTADYGAILGRPPSAAEIAASQQSLAGGASLASVASTLATGTEAQADISGFYTAAGYTPTPQQIAGGESELLSGLALSQVQGQIAALGAGSVSPVVTPSFATITPATIQGPSSPQFVYGLPDNVVAVTSSQEVVQLQKSLGSDQEIFSAFNPTTDSLLIPSKFVPGGFNSLQNSFFDTGSATALTFRQGTGTISDILLEGVHPVQLTASNFHFV